MINPNSVTKATVGPTAKTEKAEIDGRSLVVALGDDGNGTVGAVGPEGMVGAGGEEGEGSVGVGIRFAFGLMTNSSPWIWELLGKPKFEKLLQPPETK